MTEKQPFGHLMSAGAGARTIAFIIDEIIIIISVVIIGVFAGTWIGEMIFGEDVQLANILLFIFLFYIIFCVFTFLYYVLLEAIRGQTIGKIFMDVVTVSVGGKVKITFGKALLRGFYKSVLSGFGALQIIDFILIYVDERSLGDMIGGTCVVDGSSWRSYQYSVSRDKETGKGKPRAHTKCPSCGSQADVFSDGSGRCPRCKTVFVKDISDGVPKIQR